MEDYHENRRDLLDTRVALMEREIIQFGKIFEKFDATIDKLTSVTNSVDKILPILTLQISDQGKDNDKRDLKYNAMDDRITALEKFKFIWAGILIAISIILGKVPWSSIFSY
jgi:hypothetical protein